MGAALMKSKIDYTVAADIASKVMAKLRPNCERIEVAGSLRRMKSQVGDIELMIVPTEALYAQLDALMDAGKIRHVAPKRWGEKLRSFMMTTTGSNPLDVQFDLFLQPDPATWGVNMMIRTGCAEFSHRMVTKRGQGGLCPDCYTVKNAMVWDQDGAVVDTPEEADVFRLWGLDMPSPEERTENYIPMWAEVDSFGPSHGLTMARAAQIVEESKSWLRPNFGGREGAQRYAAEAIAANVR